MAVSFDSHTTGSVGKTLKDIRVDSLIISGDRTRYVQAPNVSWNKTFKTSTTELSDNLLSQPF